MFTKAKRLYKYITMELPTKDISQIEDIKLLVDTFYERIKTDLLLGPIFIGAIKDKWPEHLEKMYSFWQTVLLDEYTYQGSPFLPHAKLPVNKAHFSAWLDAWKLTIDEHFKGPKAKEAKWRGDKMAVMFLSKIETLNNNSWKPLI